ncbi:MAG: carbon-nitrogen hydrolase family protein [Ignisphaera sp.]|nr:carbon-nitrogen hydrolase family protein [Ignisphaera sp.]MCX8167466.1 carbon-nitrogen hydrolase family protein [Ignisphaera sp.]MDW8084670.1 carbon-nitrogen hydrolase family protein [Ignisphaera sp.]
MERILRLAVVQSNPFNGSIERNLSKIKDVISSVNADLYIFPEMFLTGYLIEDEVFRLALDVNSTYVRELQQTASKNGIGIIAGFPEISDRGYLYNSVLAVDDKGGIYIYRKRHLPTFSSFNESRWFKPYKGSFDPWLFKDVRIGVTVCYDIFFPEVFRVYMLKGVKLYINISAAPDTSVQLFHIMARARAVENSAYFAWINMAGFVGGFGFGGASVVVDPLGNTIRTLKQYEEDIGVVEIDFNCLNAYRIERPLLRDITLEDYYLLFKNALKYERR